MNLNNFLQLLVESREIEEIKEKNKDNGIDNILDVLASLMKGSKYDPTAMAIINSVNSWKNEDLDYGYRRDFYEFVKKRPRLVYATLKEKAKGSSNYNPAKDLDNLFYISEGNPLKEFAEYRSFEKKEKEKQQNKKKVELGIKGAKPIETEDAYLFLPHSFKTDDFPYMAFNGFRMNNTMEQQEDLKALSDQMAKRDTSPNNENGINPRVNHWCVSSSENRWYRGTHYKGGHPGGIFVIIVNKNKDGSPNWNERYLYWNTGPRPSTATKETDPDEEEYWRDNETEFADKFNKHYYGANKEKVVSRKTLKFIKEKIFARARVPKGEEQYRLLRKNIEDVEDHVAYTKKGTPRVNKESKVYKNYIKILAFLKNAYKQDNNEGEDPAQVAWKALKEFLSSPDKKGYVKSKYYVVKVQPHKFIRSKDEAVSILIWKTSDEREAAGRWNSSTEIRLTYKEARECAKDINKLDSIFKQSGRYIWGSYSSIGPASFESKANVLYDSTPPKGVRDALKNNRFAIDTWSGDKASEAMNNDETREFFIGPYFSVMVKDGLNTIWQCNKPWDLGGENGTLVGDLNDNNIVEKVKRAYAKILEGREKK